MFRKDPTTLVNSPSVKINYAAGVGGAKADATPLTADINLLGTVATAADSVLCPPAVQGACIFIGNPTANAVQVFGQDSDTIDAVATGTGVSLAAAADMILVCAETGKWRRVLTG